MIPSSIDERRRAAALLFAIASTVMACGGAAEPKAPPQETRERVPREEVAPRTIEDAQEQIARARAALDGTPSELDDLKATEPSAAPKAEPQGGARAESLEDACSGSCRALASMRRAVDALCRMTGDADERCASAKRTLSDSIRRIASCRCEAH
jgi:hypothetical protein